MRGVRSGEYERYEVMYSTFSTVIHPRLGPPVEGSRCLGTTVSHGHHKHI